jgi:hypothetical protein
MAKTLYHSALAQMGDVQVVIKSEVTPSKYKGKPPFVSMLVENEEKNYNVENDACGDALKGRIGQTLTIRALGSREEATIEILGNAPAPARNSPAQQPRQSAPQNTRPNDTHAPASAEDVTGAQIDAARAANLELIAIDRAITVYEDFNQRHDFEMSYEHFQAVASSIFIALSQRGWIDKMPGDRKLILKSRRQVAAK